MPTQEVKPCQTWNQHQYQLSRAGAPQGFTKSKTFSFFGFASEGALTCNPWLFPFFSNFFPTALQVQTGAPS